jgi:hypothetical protein
VLEQAKIVRALDRAATAIGMWDSDGIEKTEAIPEPKENATEDDSVYSWRTRKDR